MARSRNEWIGDTDDQRAPKRVRDRIRDKEAHPRRRQGEPITLAWMFDRTQRAIARAYGVDKGTIANILHRKTWRHVV